MAARGCRRRAKRRRIAGVSRKRDSGRVWLGFWVEEHARDAVNATAGLRVVQTWRRAGAAVRRSVEYLRAEQSEREGVAGLGWKRRWAGAGVSGPGKRKEKGEGLGLQG